MDIISYHFQPVESTILASPFWMNLLDAMRPTRINRILDISSFPMFFWRHPHLMLGRTTCGAKKNILGGSNFHFSAQITIFTGLTTMFFPLRVQHQDCSERYGFHPSNPLVNHHYPIKIPIPCRQFPDLQTNWNSILLAFDIPYLHPIYNYIPSISAFDLQFP